MTDELHESGCVLCGRGAHQANKLSGVRANEGALLCPTCGPPGDLEAWNAADAEITRRKTLQSLPPATGFYERIPDELPREIPAGVKFSSGEVDGFVTTGPATLHPDRNCYRLSTYSFGGAAEQGGIAYLGAIDWTTVPCAPEKPAQAAEQDSLRRRSGDQENTDPHPTERHSGALGTGLRHTQTQEPERSQPSVWGIPRANEAAPAPASDIYQIYAKTRRDMERLNPALQAERLAWMAEQERIAASRMKASRQPAQPEAKHPWDSADADDLTVS